MFRQNKQVASSILVAAAQVQLISIEEFFH